MNGQIAITAEVAAVLEACTCDEMTLYLPPDQLERKLYEQVNQILEALGGKWNRKAKGHVFTYPPADALDEALSSGYAIDQKKAFNFFETPQDLAEQLITEADLSAGMSVLEPSCGHGAIVAQMLKHVSCVDVCEINEGALSHTLERFGIHQVKPVGSDFLLFNPHALADARYDRIVANPPFSRQQDIAHAHHMIDLLKPRGVLVSIMSNGITFRTDAKTQALRHRLEIACPGYSIKALPDDAFRESGTLVKTVMLVAERH